MRGEFIGVWPETWREIWQPLIDQPLGERVEEVPEDVFCELHREIANALKEPTGDNALDAVLDDAVLLREGFERGVVLSGVPIEVAKATQVFDSSGASELTGTSARRLAVEGALCSLIGDATRASQLMSQALGTLASEKNKRAEAKERAVDRVINDPVTSRRAFEAIGAAQFAGERSLVAFLEEAFVVLDELAGDELSNRYFNLVVAFIEKFSLRYELRRPCLLCPTVPGLFTSLYRNIGQLASSDVNVARRLRDASEAVQDLRLGQTEGRISNCVAKQVMLLEAIAAAGGACGTDLKAICSAMADWPHPAIRASLLNAYGFASDFPGIRHGTPSTGMTREVDMRDMVAMSILLAGFAPYLNLGFNGEALYLGT
jgi:hypothetical protein